MEDQLKRQSTGLLKNHWLRTNRLVVNKIPAVESGNIAQPFMLHTVHLEPVHMYL